MEKKFAVQMSNSFTYKTYEDAEQAAKKLTANNQYHGPNQYVVAQAMAIVEAPTPEAVVTKL